MERARWERDANSLSMYSITENIYYSLLSSVAILLQPEPVSHRIIQGKDCVLSPYVLSSCGPTCLLLTVNEALSYFAATILQSCICIWCRNNGLSAFDKLCTCTVWCSVVLLHQTGPNKSRVQHRATGREGS
jgi:hypothetical protein